MFRWLQQIISGTKPANDHADMCRKQESADIGRLLQSVAEFRTEVRRFNKASASLQQEAHKAG